MRSLPRLAAAALCAALLPASAGAAGYSIFEQGAAVLGMAGAGTASVSDASALFFNPAALTRLEGTQLYGGATLLTPRTSFAGVGPSPGYGVVEEMEPQAFFPPTLYLAHRHGDRWALGAGVNSPYGIGVEWKNPGSFSGRSIVTKATLNALNANLTAACALTGALSAGLGFDATFAQVNLQRIIQQPYPGGGGGLADVAKLELESDYEPGLGWNAGLTFEPATGWKMGASYRSKIVVDIDEGRANFTYIPVDRGNPGVDTTFNNAIRDSLPSQGASTVLRLPAYWSVGVAWNPAEEWTLEADANLFEWSVFRDLPIRFHTTPSRNTTIVEDYEDAWQVRLGAEHRLAGYTYRFGYYFDQAAAPDASVSPILPDADRHGVTLGLGWRLGAERRWALDLYELALFVKKRGTEGVNRDNFDGEYKTYVNAAGASLAYRW